MESIYKVTSAQTTKTKRGFEVYELWLDNNIKATKLMPTRNSQRTFDKLYKFFVDNGSLSPLCGKYISLHLNKTSYGVEFSRVVSLDVIEDFKEMLDKADGKSFICEYDIYGFLKKRNYTVNQDDSITLKSPYDKYNILSGGGSTICVPNSLGENFVKLNNIKLIYEEFYKDRDPDPSNLDRVSEYKLGVACIYFSRVSYHKNLSKIVSSYTGNVLRVGDPLKKEHIEFLKNKKEI